MTRRDSPSRKCETTSAFVPWSIATIAAATANNNTATRRRVVSTERIISARPGRAGRSARALDDLLGHNRLGHDRLRDRSRLRDRDRRLRCGRLGRLLGDGGLRRRAAGGLGRRLRGCFLDRFALGCGALRPEGFGRSLFHRLRGSLGRSRSARTRRLRATLGGGGFFRGPSREAPPGTGPGTCFGTRRGPGGMQQGSIAPIEGQTFHAPVDAPSAPCISAGQRPRNVTASVGCATVRWALDDASRTTPVPFNPVEKQPDHVAIEHAVLDRWDRERTFEQLRAQNEGNVQWSFFDGPITANNPMGVHHAWGRTLKDIWQRYHGLLGHDQRYQNGFD